MNRHKASRQKGEDGESVARMALAVAGVKMVERVHTPWKVLWKDKKPIAAFPLEKVSGDFRGILPTGYGVKYGVSVLAEVKTKDTLSLSDFAQHQIDALNQNHDLGGISLIVWVNRHGAQILYWPKGAPTKGHPLKS